MYRTLLSLGSGYIHSFVVPYLHVMSSIHQTYMYVYEQIESIHATLAAPVSIRACLLLSPADAHANKQTNQHPANTHLLAGKKYRAIRNQKKAPGGECSNGSEER